MKPPSRIWKHQRFQSLNLPVKLLSLGQLRLSRVFLLLNRLSQPSILTKHGARLGALVGLAWACDLLNSMIQAGLDLPSESTELKGGLSDFLEMLSLGLSGFSWLASFPASTIEPGGYPYNIAHTRPQCQQVS